MAVIGAIFAGGRARRLSGQNKAQISLGGRTLISRQYDRISPVSDDILVLAPVWPEWIEAFSGVRWVQDKLVDDAPIGPAGALLAALSFCKDSYGESAILITAPVDAPFVPEAAFEKLIEAVRKGKPAAIAKTASGLQPAFGAWRTQCLPEINERVLQGDYALQTLASAVGAAHIQFEDESAFLNINTPEDLSAAQSRIA